MFPSLSVWAERLQNNCRPWTMIHKSFTGTLEKTMKIRKKYVQHINTQHSLHPSNINATTCQRSFLFLYCETYHPISCANSNKSTNSWQNILYNNRFDFQPSARKNEQSKAKDREQKGANRLKISFKKDKLFNGTACSFWCRQHLAIVFDQQMKRQ